LRSLKSRSNGRKRQAELTAEINAIAEQSYDQLDGEWAEWLAAAKRYEHKVPSQNRYDIRHTIIIELAKARRRDGKPIPLLRAYRIASLMIALYWRELAKHQVKVCIYNGLPTEVHCASCSHNGQRPCPYLALRAIQSLDSEIDDDGNTLADTIADDNALDLDAWLDDKTWLLGFPMRLVQIGKKRRDGIPLDNKDKCYLQRFWNKHQKRLF
jgi:hypothetical protein